MKRIILLALLMSIMFCSACCSQRQTQVEPATEHKYRLPAKHHKIHQKLLLDQNRLIIFSEYGKL